MSNHPIELMERALAVGPLAVAQHQFSLLSRQPEREGILEWCHARGIAFLAWSPLASGFLADDFDLRTLDATDLRRGVVCAHASNEQRAARIRGAVSDVARELDTTMTSVALAWVVAHRVCGPIVGPGSAFEARAAAAVVAPDASVLDRLDRAAAL